MLECRSIDDRRVSQLRRRKAWRFHRLLQHRFDQALGLRTDVQQPRSDIRMQKRISRQNFVSD